MNSRRNLDLPLNLHHTANPCDDPEKYIVWADCEGRTIATAQFVARHKDVTDESGEQVWGEEDDCHAGPHPVERLTHLLGWDVHVSPKFQRRGVATKMYEYAEKVYGVPVFPGDVQTPDGRAFLAAREKSAAG